MTQTRLPKFGIGTTYKPRGKGKQKVCIVVDIYKTYNNAGELVHFRYVSVHEFCGKLVYNYDVAEATISMGAIEVKPYEIVT